MKNNNILFLLIGILVGAIITAVCMNMFDQKNDIVSNPIEETKVNLMLNEETNTNDNKIENITNDIKEGTNNIGNKIENGVENVYNKVENGVDNFKNDIVNTIQ